MSANKMNLIKAIKSGNYPEFISLLNESAVNDKDSDGKPALYHAVIKKNIKMVDKLLEMGANINIPVYSPLHLAVINGEHNIVASLIKHGADVNLENSARKPPLLWAIQNSDLSIAELLLQRGANPNIKNREGKYILELAIDRKHCGLVAALAKNKAIVNILDEKGKSLLFQLCDKWDTNNAKIMRILLENGADPNIQDNKGDTVLMHAHYLDAIKLLLEFGANPNIINNKKHTCLGTYAASYYLMRFDIVELLLKYGANINGVNSHIKSIPPLFQILRESQLKEEDLSRWEGITQEYIYNIVRQDDLTINYTNVLIFFYDSKMLNFLLQNGADPNITDENNDTLLHFAMAKKMVKTTKLLLQYDVDIYALNNDKQTPFELAILSQDNELIKLFMEKDFKTRLGPLLILSYELDQDSLFYKDFFIRDLFFLLLRNLRC